MLPSGPALCERDGADDLGALWATLRREAVEAAERDALMGPSVTAALLRHASFGDALATRLGRKLGDEDVGAAALTALVAEAFDADPRIVEAAAADLTAVRDRDPACPDLVTPFLFFKGFLALQAYRVSHWLWRRDRQHFANHVQSRSAEVLGIDIHPAARLGCGIMIDHGTGLVIGETAVVEDDVSLLQGVTLGGTGKECGDRHPKIRRGVLLGAGAKVLGNIEVGEGAKVGAGSIVLDPVAPHTTVVGVPARPVGPKLVDLPALTMDQMLPPPDYAI
ncbi:MAG: serine O-acetyltransferase [Alphaproteobacteria bacterium]|nr:serine O-acetyltransferase [Alphaproteobacteria bacterium]